eukprot:ANDGO_05473.mRNA.1 hypothetical protein
MDSSSDAESDVSVERMGQPKDAKRPFHIPSAFRLVQRPEGGAVLVMERISDCGIGSFSVDLDGIPGVEDEEFTDFKDVSGRANYHLSRFQDILNKFSRKRKRTSKQQKDRDKNVVFSQSVARTEDGKKGDDDHEIDVNDYDYSDSFIDDEELLELMEDADSMVDSEFSLDSQLSVEPSTSLQHAEEPADGGYSSVDNDNDDDDDDQTEKTTETETAGIQRPDDSTAPIDDAVAAVLYIPAILGAVTFNSNLSWVSPEYYLATSTSSP